MILAWFVKDPDATSDFTLSWSEWIDSLDSIADLDVVADSGITVVSSSFTDTTSTVWISGGTINTDYEVLCRITTAGGRIEDKIIKILVRETTELDDLVFELRLKLGDTDPATYRYMDKWLQLALLSAVRNLQRWWNYRYLVNITTKEIYRNTAITFISTEPPIIEDADRYIIVLMAAILIKEGSLENSAWSTGSWKDAEISYSNIESSKMRQSSLKADWEELTSMIQPPTKRLASTVKNSLYGYKNNLYENEVEWKRR